MKIFTILVIVLVIIGCRNTPDISSADLKAQKIEVEPHEQLIQSEYTQSNTQIQDSKLDSISKIVLGETDSCFESEAKIIIANELWQYCEIANQIELFIYIKTDDSVRFREIYGIENDNLIFAFEEILSDYVNPENNVTWNCQYGIERMEIDDHISHGHGETESEEWEPESIFKQWEKQRGKFNELKTMTNK